MNNPNFVHWIDHPLVQHKLSLMRKKNASTNSFRTLLNELSTLMAYEFKAPQNMHERDAIVVDAMLATGNSAVAAITRIKQTQPKSIKFMCLLACPEGISNMREAHPDVHIYTAAIDRQLNEDGYILPGLGDAGDRIFGTK